MLRLWVVAFVIVGSTATAQTPDALLERAVAQFSAGQFTASAATFDTLAALVPREAPYLWQRGIALYYAKRYNDCRRQFESHRTVNPDDVENAAWHFLCVARGESPQKARAALLPVGPDRRVPMSDIYQMFQGTITPEQVISASMGRPSAEFYGHLYVGLYFDALGMRDQAIEQMKIAAADRYETFGGYMHMVANVHLRTLSTR